MCIVARVLVVEDDLEIRRAVTRALGDRGHAVSSAPTGLSGLQQAIEERPDIVLLDLGLPDIDGLQVLTMLRAVADTPVIVVTARDDDPWVVRSLDAGADDYIIKPFAPDLLDARLRAVLRRSGAGESEVALVVGGLRIDPARRTATLDDTDIELSRREFDLLAYLAGRPGQVVTKREVLADVWQQAYGGGERTVDVHLSWLRRKLGETAANPRYLHSVRGVGIRLDAPAED